jgi:hypothetical protein
MMALSFSRLSTFEQCETKFDHLYVAKDVADTDNEYSIYGNRVHEALELYAKGEAPLTAETLQYKSLVDSLLARPGDKHFELQMAIRADKSPCDWFAKDVWLRGIGDVVIINEDSAFVGDYKTGKVKDNPTQLLLFACMIMALFPKVQTVKTAFIWLAHNEVTDSRFTRDRLDQMWMTLLPRFEAVQDAVDLGVFRSKPSGLCNWCPAKDICPDRKRR